MRNKEKKVNKALNEETPTESYEMIKNWLTKGVEQLPKEQPKETHKKQRLSYKTIQILEDRGRAKKFRDLEEYERLNNKIQKVQKDEDDEEKRDEDE